MKAVVFKKIDKVEFLDVPFPIVNKGDVLVKVGAVGICGTDLELLHGKHPFVKDLIEHSKYGLIPGHEWSGIIEDSSNSNSILRKGDKVVGEVGIWCGNCIYCRGIRNGICSKLIEIGITRNGAMAEYVAVPEKNLHKIPSNISFEEAALFEPASVLVRALKKLGKTEDELPNLNGLTVAVFGDGPIGLLAVKLLKIMNASKIITIGKSEKKLSYAQKFGSDICINSGTSHTPLETISKNIGDTIIDVVLEAAGGKTVVNETLQVVRSGGTVMLVGLHNKCEVNIDSIVTKEVNVKGSLSGSNAWEDVIKLVQDNKLKLTDIITNTFSLEHSEEAFKLFDSDPDVIKIIMNL